jgi:hypothetical protein
LRVIWTEHIRIDPAYRRRLAACGLDTVDRVLSRVEGRVAAWSRTTDTLFVPGADGQPGFYIKRHFHPGWKKRLRGTFRGTFFGAHRGEAEYNALHRMRVLGVPAVRPVAYGGRRIGHFLAACFLITEEVPEAQNLTSFAQDIVAGRRPQRHAERVALIHALADQVRALHETGFSHGNLFWRNVLIRSGPAGEPEFFFLDVQTRPLWGRVQVATQRWLRELAQTAVSAAPFATRADHVRFAERYFRQRRLKTEQRQKLREIERMSRSWRDHEDRRIHMNRLFEAWNQQLAVEWAETSATAAAVRPGTTP